MVRLRDSFAKYQLLCGEGKSLRSDKWFALLDKTEWPYHLLCAIGTANQVLRLLMV